MRQWLKHLIWGHRGVPQPDQFYNWTDYTCGYCGISGLRFGYEDFVLWNDRSFTYVDRFTGWPT